MKITKIVFPSFLSEIEEPDNDNIDVFIELDDGSEFSIVVTTPQNYYWYMDKEGIDYIPAGQPFVIVRRLEEGIIKEAIETYVKNKAYWLKYYYLAGSNRLNITLLNKLIEETKVRNTDLFVDKDL